jgi:hypothetical protein
VRRVYQLLHFIFITLTILYHKKGFFSSKFSVKFEKFAQFDFKKIFHNFSNNMLFIAYTENTATYSHRMKPKLSPPSPPTVQSQAPLGSCWTAAHGINSSSNSWQPFSHPTHSGLFHS